MDWTRKVNPVTVELSGGRRTKRRTKKRREGSFAVTGWHSGSGGNK
jgi:hypothetical protein